MVETEFPELSLFLSPQLQELALMRFATLQTHELLHTRDFVEEFTLFQISPRIKLERLAELM